VVALDANGSVLTQGDRHRAPDGFVSPEHIIGVVHSFELGGRTYSVAPSQPRPRPSAYRMQRQRITRVLRRLSARRA